MSVNLPHLAALMSRGRFAELERQAFDALRSDPESGMLWQLLAAARISQGKDARHALNRVIRCMPEDATAHNNLGNACARDGQFPEAIASYQRALELRPRFIEAHDNLARALLSTGQFAAAETSCRHSISLRPNCKPALENLGDALMALGRADEAVACFRHAVEIDPKSFEALTNLGNAILECGDTECALACHRRAIEINPEFAVAHNNLGNALRSAGQIDEAVASYDRALQLMPVLADAHCNRAIALRLLGFEAQARAACCRALEISSRCVSALITLAELSADNGDFGEAERLFKQAIAIEPGAPEAWAGLAGVCVMNQQHADWLTHAQAIAERDLPPRKLASLEFAIGKCLDDLKQYDAAFVRFRRANEHAKRFRPAHDREDLTRTVDAIIRDHDKNSAGQRRSNSSDSVVPVFIVGMPRSGTTLAEQILASHPLCSGVGELPFWSRAYAAELRNPGSAKIGEYLQLLRKLAPVAQRIVDKMPTNFAYLGLIHACLPNARIIHMKRDPLDTCLSIYFQNFEMAATYANDLGDTAHYYAEYLRLMKHWRASLSANDLLEVRYEDLVSDQESWSRKMIEFIGLAWDARSLDFHRTRRPILTASRWQVRQKINAMRVGRWRNYEKQLGPLRGLASAVVAGRSNCE